MAIKTNGVMTEGDVLTREYGHDNFVLNESTIGEEFSSNRTVSLSPSLINKDEFKAIEWFVDKDMHKKNKVAKLKEEISALNAELDGAYKGWIRDVEKLEADAAGKQKMEKLIDEKLEEFNIELEKAKMILNKENIGAMEVEAENEKLVVYTNMIYLLKTIKG